MISRDEHLAAIVGALRFLGLQDVEPQLPSHRAPTRSELASLRTEPRRLYKAICVALYQPPAVRKFRELMEVHESLSDCLMSAS